MQQAPLKVLTLDFETTTHSNGSVYDQRNQAVCLAVKYDNEKTNVFWDNFAYVGLYSYDFCVAFNAKFDVAWLRRHSAGVHDIRVWCCQVAEYVLSGQTIRYPSLEDTAIKYGLGHKLDVVKTEYWDKGIQTTDIPKEILEEYAAQDVDLTYQVFLLQWEQFQKNPKLYKLFKLMCQDLLILHEMEWNGQIYNVELCHQRSEETKQQVAEIKKQLDMVYPDLSINFGSGDQLSAFLYGGKIFYEETEHVGFYKNGNPKYKKVEKFHILPRLVEPLKRSELKKEGYYKTDAETLGKLKGPAAKRYVGPLLKLSELEKLNSTYYEGLHAKNRESHWPDGHIHGQFNQVVASTGRLSSSSPNLQNFSGECLDLFVTRFLD